ncbi:hypothetical protein LWI28_012852 [Acer negundo]|uniref:Uncharacterized protein n=1 Tax=Acer negundo TaxID=4023 RepID=A0AAD5NIK6_ACENE|nr:hypothetical protein LWI28_012852 [Acer negundo]KAK4838078.1 hypothetical protein QYF36_010793 [Acer negundo]
MPMPVIPDGYDDDDDDRLVREITPVKYQVDLRAVAATFNEMVRSSLEPWDLHYYVFSILSVVREENDEDSYLV